MKEKPNFNDLVTISDGDCLFWSPIRISPEYPKIARVIFNNPATIVYWEDGTKTVVKCQPGDTFDYETGLMAAMLKRFMGNDNTFNKVLKAWMPKVPALTDGQG